MLEGAEVKTDTDYFDFIKENPDIADKTVYTGMIDPLLLISYTLASITSLISRL